MLVDNDVRFDSRVQKEAGSAAERGWDVVLLGKSLNRSDAVSWKIGKAEVQLVFVRGLMGQRRFEYRRAPLRSPFAYPPGTLAAFRRQQSKAWKAELNFRQARLATGPHRFASLRLIIAKVYRRWVAFRSARTAELAKRRRAMDRPLDRFTTWWWKKMMGNRAWRKLDPGIWDWELTYGPVIDDLKPDLIHANDFRMLAIGARAATRAKAAGRDVKLVWDAHEYLPGMRPWQAHPRWHLAQCALERDFASRADAVVTVSDKLADWLIRDHHLPERPTIVLNAPIVDAVSSDGSSVIDIRQVCGLTESEPLIVYSGLARQKRGLDILIESLPLLNGVHVAIVLSDPALPYVISLVKRAEELGVDDRLHLAPYVPVERIVPFLSTADIGVIPIHHWPNHEIALITKFFEYSHARLPIVVSDVEAMAAMIRSTGQGEVFVAEDLEDYVRAINKILADKNLYLAAYDAPGLLDAWTWERQADELDRVYSQLLSAATPASGPGESTDSTLADKESA